MAKRSENEGISHKCLYTVTESHWAAKRTSKLPSGKHKCIVGYGPTRQEAIEERERKLGMLLKATPAKIDATVKHSLDNLRGVR